MNNGVLITAAIVAIMGVFVAWSSATTIIEENPFRDKGLLEKGMDLPILWLYIDDSSVNSRNWLDFMGRSTRAIQLPFLNLCYSTIVSKNKGQYRVEVIGGLSDLAVRLGGWEKLPGPLQASIASVGEAEKNWIRACVLAKWGGLWLDPATISLRGFGTLPSDKVVFFGTDNDETFSGPRGTEAPGLRCLWSPRPAHPLFIKWEKMSRERIDTHEGGKQFRGDEKWDARQLAGEFKSDISYLPNSELSRKRNGRRIQLEDLLAAGQQGSMTFEISKESIYIPLSWKELSRSRQFEWFLKMSEDQIMSSDLVVSHLFRTANM